MISSAASIRFDNPILAEKFGKMTSRIKEFDRVLVAYSGGIDSTLVLKIGTLALGPECIGVTAKSETLTDEEFELAAQIARDHGMRQHVIEYSELEIEHYADNPVNRCFFCKHELYDQMQAVVREFNAEGIFDGTNADDVGDWRPGIKAADKFEVIHILRDADMHKDEIRRMALQLGLANWNKPSGACLSSRVPYGEKIDREKLKRIGDGESFLRKLGFTQVRLRHHDNIARIEVEAGDIARLADPEIRERAVNYLRSIGFLYVTLDLAGYRTGSMNEAMKSPSK